MAGCGEKRNKIVEPAKTTQTEDRLYLYLIL